MHLGDPSGLETTSSSAVGEAMMDVTVAHEGINGGGGGGEMMDTNSGDDEKRNNGGEEGDKMNCGGNRWPRQETFALLKIRSDMDAAFRDSSLKGPLWEEVSRKLGELGYHRSAKKCKEKFENVYKYHKRTKESRSGKPEGKTYKFFDQLQALENHQFTLSSHTPTPTSKPPQPSSSLPTNTITLMQSTRPSIDVSETTISYVPPAAAIPSTNPTLISPPPPPPPTNARNVLQQGTTVPYSLPNMNLVSTTSTSSSTASDEDMEARYRKKRKWKDYFRRLTRQVLAEQEEMQKRFLEAIDKRERERVAQQEAWRIQEMARINREHDILVQERSTAAAKDAAVIAFLQKLSGQTPPPPPLAPQPSPPPPQVQPQQQQPQQQLQQPPLLSINNNFEIQKMNNGSGHGQSGSPMSSSRWPKAEVQALIRLRTTLDAKYQENGPKGPLWEDISAGLQRLGYNRSAKRCKEKWENINKYFKKVKESSKQRREDSKTCPYFHELEVLYKEKSKTHNPVGSSFYNSTTKQPNEMMEPLMVQPEQQWRPPPPPPPVMEEQVKEREGGIEEEEEEDIDDVEEDGDSVEDEERYEIATNKLSSVDTVE